MRRPWVQNPKSRQALKERNTRSDISHFQCSIQNLFWLTRGDALRSAQRLPLAILFRAFGAALFRAFGAALFRAFGAGARILYNFITTRRSSTFQSCAYTGVADL